MKRSQERSCDCEDAIAEIHVDLDLRAGSILELQGASAGGPLEAEVVEAELSQEQALFDLRHRQVLGLEERLQDLLAQEPRSLSEPRVRGFSVRSKDVPFGPSFPAERSSSTGGPSHGGSRRLGGCARAAPNERAGAGGEDGAHSGSGGSIGRSEAGFWGMSRAGSENRLQRRPLCLNFGRSFAPTWQSSGDPNSLS